MTTTPPAAGRRFGDGGTTLADAGEERLLHELRRLAAPPVVGDDAAVWTPRGGQDLAISIDALVEAVDFRREWMTPRQLGRRAFAVAVSDLAGTGAVAVNCVATLCAPPSEQVEDVLEIQRGLVEAAASAGCAVVGGDISATDGPLVIDVCVTGELPPGRSLRRNAGVSGDLLVVTGVLGRAAAGLRLLAGGHRAEDSDGVGDESTWISAQLQPVSRLAEGRRLLDAGVRCGGDVSDGLLVDARRTAQSSGCAAELWVDALPVDPGLRGCFSHDWLQLAVGGGEDFELLLAVPAALLDSIRSTWDTAAAPLTVVGRLREGTGVYLLTGAGGDEVQPPPASSRHFS